MDHRSADNPQGRLAPAGKVAEVIVDLHVPDVDRVFHYVVPPALQGRVKLGHRVLVPFGHRPRVEGYVIGFGCQQKGQQLKEILEVVDEEPLLTAEQIAVARWMREHYLCPLVQALQCFLPPGSRLRRSRVVRTLTCTAYRLQDPQRASTWIETLKARAPKQAEIVQVLDGAGGAMTATELRSRVGAADRSLSALVEKGVLVREEVELRREPGGELVAPRKFHRLNPEQQRALDTILALLAKGESARLLLQGVTGSGKTEVYLQAMAAAVKDGKGAIFLVPEIALTPQTIAYFRAHFGEQVAVLHSRLSAGERYDEWWRIFHGEVSIVVGARSAVFAPVRRLGMIILDEEHETSYKQEESPRYHARDVAWMRAREEGALLILGSATPAVEVRAAADAGEYAFVSLPSRVHARPLPRVETVDMREELLSGNRSMFSRLLREKMEAALLRGEQALLFMNRRGLASFVLCRECGYVPRCDSCEVSLTLHLPATLRCHYCDATQRLPAACPQCGGIYLRPFGGGTQRIEQEVVRLFPHARPVRMDLDTTSRKGAHARIIDAFAKGRYNVLIGTQMVAKGLHFPGVTLVGVVLADVGLHLPDYRAAERTFQILAQVAGRAGRGNRAGEVVIQTYAPDHYAVAKAAAHDYEGFYQAELEYRRRVGYPPYAALVRCLWSGEKEEDVIREAQQSGMLGQQLANELGIELVGPSPAPLSRLKGRFRWHFLLKGKEERVIEAARRIKRAYDEQRRTEVRLAVDVDPMGLL